MKNFLWKTANAILGGLGYELRRKVAEPPAFTMQAVLERARKHCPGIQTVVDLGAAEGRWTRKALRHFPDARFLMVEPLEERRSHLEALKAQHSKVDFALAAAGDREGTARLTVAEDLDGSGIYARAEGQGRTRDVVVTTVDAEVARRALPAPYLLKFDTHGFEVPILAGATETLRQTAALLVEVHNFQLSAQSLRFHEMCAHLEKLGFRCADLADPLLRQHDNVLWQFDVLFLPATHAAFAHPRYH